MLTDATYAAQNTQTNQVIQSQLAVATVGRIAHNLIKNMKAIRMDMKHGTLFISGMMVML